MSLINNRFILAALMAFGTLFVSTSFASSYSSDRIRPISTSHQIVDTIDLHPNKEAVVYQFELAEEPFDPARNAQIQCLARNIYFEARGESRKGQLAVGFVTVNRAKSKAYPDDLCKVVHQKYKGICQFSWVCDRNSDVPKDSNIYRSVHEMAVGLYDNYFKRRHMDDIVSGSTHFHTTKIRPKWARSLQRKITIGSHVFYAFKRSSRHSGDS